MIISAAVKIITKDGKEHIIPVHRHSDAYQILHEFGIDYVRGKDVQGFIKYTIDQDDEFNGTEEFVTRVEAFKHAQTCGQINPNEPLREAYSEDFY